MSDFESEHDSDSSEDAVAPIKNNRPVSDGGGDGTASSNAESKVAEDEQRKTSDDVEDQVGPGPASLNANDVADKTADFLAELRQAGEKPSQNKNQQNSEPWQLYLQQQQATASHTYQDPNDGTIFEWDAEKRAWFPKVANICINQFNLFTHQASKS